MNISSWLYQTALARPDWAAIRSGSDLHATYAEFAGKSAALGNYLCEVHGIRKGDRVAIFVRNCVEYLEVLHGIFWIGAVAVPVNYKLHPREAAWIVENAQARIIFTESGDVFGETTLPTKCVELGLHEVQAPSTLATPPAAVANDDLAWLFYTSGTTGRPKGVMLTHANLRAMAMTYTLDVDSVSRGDHVLYAAPMSHGAGLYNFQFIRAGACHVIPPSQGFQPAEITGLAGKMTDMVFFAAPTMIKRLVAHAQSTGSDGAGIRSIIYGGGPMYAADIRAALETFGPKFIQIYGQGESPMTITALPRDLVADTSHPRADHRRASVGIAHACVEVRVVDDAMQDVPGGEVGEIVVRGDTVMKGYWRNEAATAETIVDGWLRTGDLGALDADGFLTLTDRSKDVIISGGTNIYPREVEEALLGHADVFEVSVIGVPSAEWGEDVAAFVVLRPGASCDRDALDRWCRNHIASFKKPKIYFFVTELPKNSYGKILKTDLRAQAAERF